MLSTAHPYMLRVLDDLGAPITAAVIDVGGSQAGTTTEDGTVELVWSGSAVLEVSAPGHVPQRITLSAQPEARFDVVLRARVLRGRVVDESGEGVDAVAVAAGPARGVTDHDGYFQLRGAEEGEVEVTRPAWVPTSFVWTGGTGESVVEIEPLIAKAVHIDGDSMENRFDEFVDMAMTTELNALMVDLKGERGHVWYETRNETAIEVGADYGAYNLEEVVRRANDLGLYVIGRLVVFMDPIAAVNKPELAVWDTELNAPYEARGQYFLDPTKAEARAYGMELAIEACSMGIDEVQFDYVRFPDARRESASFAGGVTPEIRQATISGFLAEAVDTLRPMGCAVGADVFGFLTTARDDGGIGQVWEDVAGIVDVVSPMIYPSHYHPEFYDFPSTENPGRLVDRALADGIRRLDNSRVIVRPWLQDFGYDPARVREQIDAAESHGLGWMLWNAESQVTVDALQPAGEATVDSDGDESGGSG